ncbi:E3 ubiquitin-protein ligase msl-2 [Musca domestica]|uniref:E3 ubiquitin-protein ligase msl-2 n=1 Tax=Musca domestica TaxID=7370 RepID=A0A9J7CQU0_MUSDO|nr:E3 ubiquitin-protein ligase msl-2 [Musca domestica]
MSLNNKRHIRSFVAMNAAVSVYVNAAKLVLQTTELSSANSSTNNELPRQLLNLRQLLSCVVCCRLATDPFSPSHGHCNHSVCRLCIRGQKNLSPSCVHCRENRDYKTYEENKQLRCLLVCYKSLCEHLRSSHIFPQLAGRKLLQFNVMSPTLSMPQMSLQDLIVEGASYDDIMSSFSKDLPKPQVSYAPNNPHPKQQPQMPALVVPLSTTAATPLAPLQQNIKCSGVTQSTAPKASTPPTSASGPISNLPQTHVPKIKVETTSPTFKPLSHLSAPANHGSTPGPQQSSNTTTYNHPQLIQLNQLKNAGNITYIGPNTRGIVVPIVSSSGTTTVPLSIASARLQTLNRQLAQARALQVVSSATTPTATNTQQSSVSSSATDVKPQLATFKVSLAPTQLAKTVPSLNTSSLRTSAPTATTTLTNAFTTATVTSQIRNPPAIKTVSNGSAMYSVLYTGIGNKITIKRKTDGDEDVAQKKNVSTSAPNATILRPISKTINKKRGCRCGNTTSTPGKLTCCGQRCPCYVDSKSCIGCKCRGCRNPHRPDGMKVRPVIPELACYEIQMADDHGNVNELPIATSSTRLAPPTNGEANETVASPAATTPLNMKPSFEGAAALVSRNVQVTPRSSPLPNTTTNTVSVQHTPNVTQASLSSSTTSVASTISTTPGNIVQLDQMQRESLLIQNAEGKFQVVNLFTTGTSQSANQVPGLQMLQSLPQAVVSVSGSNNFILPSTISTTAQHASSPVATASLPLILQNQQQHQPQIFQQQQQHHQALTSQRISTGTLPLQLQQQLKQNIITVHTIGSNANANTSPASASVLTPSSSPAPTTATLTLAPMMISNPQTQTANSTTTEILENCGEMSQHYTNLVVTSSSAASGRDVTSLPVVSLGGGGTITHRNTTINLKSLGSPNT